MAWPPAAGPVLRLDHGRGRGAGTRRAAPPPGSAGSAGDGGVHVRATSWQMSVVAAWCLSRLNGMPLCGSAGSADRPTPPLLNTGAR